MTTQLTFSEPVIAWWTSRTTLSVRAVSGILVAIPLSMQPACSVLGLSPSVLFAIAGWYVLDVALAALVVPRIARGAEHNVARHLVLASAFGVGCAHAAASTHVLSPAWCFALSTVELGARVGIARVRSALFLGAGMPVALRLLLAPDPSAASLVVALATGATWTVATVLLERFYEQRARRTRGLDPEERGARATVVEQLNTSLAIHDSLSGPLFVLRTRLESAASHEEGSRHIETFLRTIGPWQGRGHPDVQWLVQLSLLVEQSRSELEAHCLGLDHLSEDERKDVAFIAREAVLNVARMPGTRVRLDIHTSNDAVRVVCASSGAEPIRGGGRGLRNIRLRTWARGGTVSIGREADQRSLSVSWPRGVPRGARLVPRIALASLVVLALIGLRVGWSVWVLPLAVTGAGIVAMNVSRERGWAAHITALARAPGAASDRAIETLDRALRALEQTVGRGSLEAQRAAARALSGSVTDVLHELDMPGLAEVARDAQVSADVRPRLKERA